MDIADIVAIIISIAALAVALGRRRNVARQSLESVVRDAVDYAEANPQAGIPTERTALDAARLGDVRVDGKRDFSDAQLIVGIRAEIHRRKK